MPRKLRNKKTVYKNRNIKKTQKKEKIKNYAPEALEQAIAAVKKGSSLREAANMYSISVTTIFRTLKNPEHRKATSGPSTIFTKEEEQEIVQWIFYRAERGYPVTKTELLDSVQSFVIKMGKETPFTNGRPGRHWYERFYRHHPSLSIRSAQHLNMARASVTEEDLRGWFNEIQNHLQSKNLLDIHPSRVFNCEETNIQLLPKPERVLTKKGACSVYKIVDANEKESITTLFMYNAEGTRAPPMIMYKYKESVPKKVLENCPHGWGIGTSESGWMTIETFYEYMTNVFYPWLLTENVQFPVLVYLDGHSSHVTIPLVSFCREKKIELIALYPNATHIIQPLDIAVFHPFKDIWRKTVPKWKVENNITKLKKEQFPIVLKKALESYSAEKKNVQNGFRASGLMPFDPNVVDYNGLQKKKRKSNLTDQQQLENPQVLPNNVTEDKKQHLQTFENNLSNSILEDFKKAESTEVWTGDFENKGLFEYWLKIKKAVCDNHIEVKPTIRSIEKLNHKVILNTNRNKITQATTSLCEIMQLNTVKEDVVVHVDENIITLDSVTVLENCTNDHIILENRDISQTEPNSDTHSQETGSNVYNSCQVLEENAPNVIAIQEGLGNKENREIFTENRNDCTPTNSFATAFTLPPQYLPKKKRCKLDASGKCKLPAVGTSDEWWRIAMQKEEQQKMKQEKALKKKLLQEEKRKLAEEKRKLQEKINEIQKKIKNEKIE